jgi:anthraniloyl-CoA monooxygenase
MTSPVKIDVIGAGPAGLYFAILMKKADPACEITIFERNAPHQTFGWGVVFSDETLGYLEENDPETHREITGTFAHWDAIDVHLRGKTIRSGGHGFSGIARGRLLAILERRAEQLGVKLRFGTEVSDLTPHLGADLVLAADGVKSRVRGTFEDAFKPSFDFRKNRYIWLGTNQVFDAFTFIFEETPHGLFWVHAYRFDKETSTFIVECDEETWKRAGMDRCTADESVAALERIFARYLGGHRLLTNKSSWINFVTIKNDRWRHRNTVLLGDAAHTAHFSIGSGTKMAMEDAIALVKALRRHPSVDQALAAYEAERRPIVERTQKAAQDSLDWFENVGRYWKMEPLQIAFSLLTRSKRISYENLRLRDPAFVERVDRWYADANGMNALRQAQGERSDRGPATQSTAPVLAGPRTPPMFVPFTLRGMSLVNRVVVSPMSMYSADDGLVDDFHLVHLGSKAMGGAGLVFTEMTDVSRDGRITPGCAGMYRPEHLPAWKRIVDFVHGHSQARICLQVAHAGRKGSTRRMWEGIDEPLDEGNWPLISASPIPYLRQSQVPREMDRADMDRVLADFVRAAKMADGAGFDMLEIHMAHGYLLASFLSPLTNVRKDAYGGPLERRMRYPMEVFQAVRAVWQKPLSVRLSATDWVPGGFDGDQAVELSRALRSAGVDIIDVSAGQTTPDSRPAFYGRMFQTPFSDRIRNEVGVPTIAVGNISNHDQVNSILAAGRADLCALARPHLLDPHWTLRAAAELGHQTQPWPPQFQSGRPRSNPS